MPGIRFLSRSIFSQKAHCRHYTPDRPASTLFKYEALCSRTELRCGIKFMGMYCELMDMSFHTKRGAAAFLLHHGAVIAFTRCPRSKSIRPDWMAGTKTNNFCLAITRTAWQVNRTLKSIIYTYRQRSLFPESLMILELVPTYFSYFSMKIEENVHPSFWNVLFILAAGFKVSVCIKRVFPETHCRWRLRVSVNLDWPLFHHTGAVDSGWGRKVRRSSGQPLGYSRAGEDSQVKSMWQLRLHFTTTMCSQCRHYSD